MSEANPGELLLEACDTFVKNISKYNWAMMYESDLRCAIYAELIKAMDRRGMKDYTVRTEHKYGDFQADIALGDKQELAIEVKYSFTYWRLRLDDFVNAKKQLGGYLSNGAKDAYLIVLDHQIPPERKPISDTIDIGAVGLVGEWRAIDAPEIAEDKFLVAQLSEKPSIES